ncbi:MAG: NADH-quinone oxidoreductase subunit NuoB [Pseudomonadota bacterium]|nr:NADH-quinone oxidoreductase subunit NuoB [Pseudomonadota bacterium]MDE3142417.1 NADH-quinone oxidoreductase subunit NuoB [Pseudomonadota bacterium]
MLRILNRITRTGNLTEPLDTSASLEALGIAVQRTLDARFAGSLAIRHIDAGSCNGCELEVQALGNPYYDLERFGIHFVASPRHADALLVTGVVTRHMQAALLDAWQAMAEPHLLIAAGNCACDGGEFGCSYASLGAVENVLPVDVRIPGCPPTPAVLLRGLLAALGRTR